MTQRLPTITVLLFSTLCVFGHSQEPSAVNPSATASPSKPATDQTSQFAYIHVYRQRRYIGSGLSPTITVDQTKVARVGNGRRFTAKVTPGTHTINSDDKSSAVTVEAAAGQSYYIRVDEEAGAWKGHGRLTLLMPEQGKPEYQLQKPVEADRRLSKEMLMEDADGPANDDKK